MAARSSSMASEDDYETEQKMQAAADVLFHYSQFVMVCIGEDVRPTDLRLHLMKFRVTVTSDAGDIPSLLDQVREKLNRNVELITAPADTKNSSDTTSASHHMDGKNYRRYATGDGTKKEKPVATAAAAANTAAGPNQAPPPYAYLALVPIAGDTASSMYHAPYLQGLPGTAGDAVHAQRQSNPLQHAHFNSTAKKYGGAGDAVKDDYGDRDEKKGNVTADHKSLFDPAGIEEDWSGLGGIKSPQSAPIPFNSSLGKGSNRSSREADPVPVVGVKRKDGGKITVVAGNATAIGVPVHTTVTAGVPELQVAPPSYGHGGYLPYAQGGHHAGHCCQNNAGGPPDAATAGYNHHYSWYPDMFSDENPNACSVI